MVGAACGATNDFTPGSGDWNSAGNWSLGTVPQLSEDVTIGAGKTVTVLGAASTQAIYANSITIAAGGALQLTSGTATDGVELTIATNLTINGQMTAGGALNGVKAEIVFTNGAPQISGSGMMTFGDSAFSTGANGIIVQDNAALTLGGTITVAGTAWAIHQANAADGTTLSAVVTIGSTATMTVPSGTLSLNDGINLTNRGALNLGSGANVIYDSNQYSDFTQTAGGHLNWTLNGNSLSAFLSPYSVHLAGELALTRPSTYFPSAGDTVTLFNLVQSNMIGDFTTFTRATDFSNDFVPATRTYAFAFLRDPQIITWSQSIPTQAINGANVDLMAMSNASSSSVTYVTYTVALASGGAASSTIIPSSGPGVRAQLHPGSASESIIITAHALRTGNYDDAMPINSAAISISAGLQTQTITFDALSPLSLASPTRALVASATSGLAIFYLTSNTAIATVDNTAHTVTAIAPGLVDITACQTGNATYAFAPSVTRSLLVTSPLAQTITFQINGGAPMSLAIGTSITLTGTSSAGLPLTYTSSDASVASIAASVLTALSIGTVTVTASQAGDATHAPAVSQTSTAVIVTETSARTIESTVSSGTCGAGGGVALILGALLLGWRRRA